jgi:hypothetical protein
MDEGWTFEHSVICPVTKEFAWNFWTTVSNWRLDSDVESVELNGPFETGSRGATNTRSSGRIEWRLSGVVHGEAAVVEIALPGATGQFRWTFEDVAAATRITQRVSIAGEQATSLVAAIAPGLESGIPAGMQRLSEALVQAVLKNEKS